MKRLVQPHIFYQIIVKPAIWHPAGPAVADYFPDSPVRRIFVRLRHVFLVELVPLGFSAVQNRAVGGGEPPFAMSDVGPVQPDVFVYVIKGVVKIPRSQIGVVLRIINDEEIPVFF